MEYVDKNANTINSTDYGKPFHEDSLVQLIDKLQIDNDSNLVDQAAHNHIGAAAVTPALLLANHINAPTLSNEKLHNGDTKGEVSTFLYFILYIYIYTHKKILLRFVGIRKFIDWR